MGLLGLTTVFTGVAQAEIAWRADLSTAQAEAEQSGKALLLHFTSDNCVWCDRLEAGAFQSPQVGAAVEQKFVPVKIHAGKSPELAKMFGVTKFPTDVMITPTGKHLGSSVSPQDPTRYVAMLGQASSKMPAAPVSPAPNAPQTMLASNAQPSASAPTQARAAVANTPPRTQQNPHVASSNNLPSPDSQFAGGATAQLAGARTDGMSLGMPAQAQAKAKTPAFGTDQPKLAMEGFCSVTVINEDQWVEGNPKFGVVHLGKLYLFASEDKMKTFLADPTPYTPVLNEIDVVRFFEERVIVPGKRQFGMKDPVHQRMFFFADEAAMDHFWNEYERYTDAAIEVMDQAVRDANPGLN
jgi:protein disulfide-isomerase